MEIKLIAATSLNGTIGQNNSLPWGNDYPEDLAFFRKMTVNSTIIMGRNTFQSINKALPKRRNIVLSKKIIPDFNVPGIEIFSSMESALETCNDNVWIIGGSFVYQNALKFANELYITTIPKIINGENLVYFPYINPDMFSLKERIEISKDKNLYCNRYVKI